MSFSSSQDEIEVLQFLCIGQQYYIHIQRLFNSNIKDHYACLTKIKLAMEVKYTLCKQNNKVRKFNKCLFIYENI